MATKKKGSTTADRSSTTGSPAGPPAAARRKPVRAARPATSKAATTEAPARAKARAPAIDVADQRVHPRVSLGLLIQIRASSIEEFKRVHCDNISLGGMFLKTDERRPLGAEVFFQFTLKDGGTLIEGLGRVVRLADDGMGLQFVSVLEPSATIIQRLVEGRLAAER